MMLHLCDTQWPNSGLFLQNALVEYIGVYSDTNDSNFNCYNLFGYVQLHKNAWHNLQS